MQKNSHKTISVFHTRKPTGRKGVDVIIKMIKEKNANQEHYIQQNYPSKNEREIKTFPDKQKLRKFITTTRPTWQEILKGALKVGEKKRH